MKFAASTYAALALMAMSPFSLADALNQADAPTGALTDVLGSVANVKAQGLQDTKVAGASLPLGARGDDKKTQLAQILSSHGVSTSDQKKILNNIQRAVERRSSSQELSDLIGDKLSPAEKKKVLQNVDLGVTVADQKVARADAPPLPDVGGQLGDASKLLENIDVKTPLSSRQELSKVDLANQVLDDIALKTAGAKIPIKRRDAHGHTHSHSHGHGHGHSIAKAQEPADSLTAVISDAAGALGARQESTDPLTGVITNVAGALGVRQESTDPLTGVITNVAGAIGVRDEASDPVSSIVTEALHSINSLGSRDVGVDKVATVSGLENVQVAGMSLSEAKAPLRRLVEQIAQADLGGLEKSKLAGLSLPGVQQRAESASNVDLSGLEGVTVNGENLSHERQNLLRQAVANGYGVLKEKRLVTSEQQKVLESTGVLVSGKDNGFQGKSSRRA